MSYKNEIDLNNYRQQGVKVFTGRAKGKEVRESANLLLKEKNNDKIKIIVPEDIYSINPSFLEEFLRPVVKRLRKDKFYEKFEFICKGPYNIIPDLNEAVDRILSENNALV